MAVEALNVDPSPPIPGRTRDLDLNAPSSFHEAFPVQIASPAATLRRFSIKKARASRHRIEKQKHLSRPVSSPTLHAARMSDSEADKKRNKLGYQRISIACGKHHCLPSRAADCLSQTTSCRSHGAFTDLVQHTAAEGRSDVY